MEHKQGTAFVTGIEPEQGVVEAVFSVFGITDDGNDVVWPGSFRKTFSERAGKIRVLDSHNADSVMSVIGKPVELREMGRTELPPAVLEKYPEATGGAYAKVQFLLDTPEGKGAFTRVKSGAVDEWSFGYDALDFDYDDVETPEGKRVMVRNLRTLKLYEISPVIWGMNPATSTTSAKARPSEGKPVEETENSVRVRVRDPGDFQEGSFRTIAIGDEGDGIQAVIGKLPGEDGTTVQTYIFDNEKWTVDEATAWVEDHKDGKVKKEAYPWDECIAEQTERYGSQDTAERVCGMIRAEYGGRPTEDIYQKIEAALDIAPKKKSAKAGRRVRQAKLEALRKAWEDFWKWANYEDEEEEEDDEDRRRLIGEAPNVALGDAAGKTAVHSAEGTQAGPAQPPTSELLAQIEIGKAQLELLEVKK